MDSDESTIFSTLIDLAMIDSHQHFWYYDQSKHSWIDDNMSVIRRDFLPYDLKQAVHDTGVDGCIAVQADQTEVETNFLIGLSQANLLIKGIVGWVNLSDDHIEDRLGFYKQFEIVKGFRHVLQSETPEFMLQDKFLRGIRMLRSFGYTYDILIYPIHLSAAKELVKRNPEQPFVLDHIAKPDMRLGITDQWKNGIKALASFDNVYCKISGMVTEAEDRNWTNNYFTPYIDIVVESFGIDRVMYGSDWPVCLSAANSYIDVLGIVQEHFSRYTFSEQEKFFKKNASLFYKL